MSRFNPPIQLAQARLKQQARNRSAQLQQRAKILRQAQKAQERQNFDESLRFYQHLGAEDRIVLEPHIDQDEVFDDQFERRAHEIQRIPGGDSGVSIIPAKQGPWTGNNQLGIEREFQDNTEARQSILKMDEWGFPQVWSVMLGMTFSDPVAEFSVIAEVECGVGGAIQTFEMDWNQGATFSCVANALNIVAVYSETTSVPEDLRLSAIIGHRSLNGNKPTRTVNVRQPNAPADQLVVIAIPKFAYQMTVIPRANTSPFDAAITYEMFTADGSGGSLASFTGDVLASPYGGTVRIPGGANVLNMDSSNPLKATQCALVFDLAL